MTIFQFGVQLKIAPSVWYLS